MIQLKLEVIVLPVADVDRAKESYQRTGCREDVDFVGAGDSRVVHLTPPGSAASIVFGQGVSDAEPGSAQGLQLIVDDFVVARNMLVAAGVNPKWNLPRRRRGVARQGDRPAEELG